MMHVPPMHSRYYIEPRYPVGTYVETRQGSRGYVAFSDEDNLGRKRLWVYFRGFDQDPTWVDPEGYLKIRDDPRVNPFDLDPIT